MGAHHDARAQHGRQFSIFLDDRPGTLGQVMSLLGEREVNVYALTLAEGTGHGYVRMVVDRHEDAAAVLREAGYLFFERDIVLLEIANTPGSLAAVACLWGGQGINIEYTYCAGGPAVDRGLVIVRAEEVDRAVSLVNE